MIYLASSWRNTERLDLLAEALGNANWTFYDFRADDEKSSGFHWSDLPGVDPGAGNVAQTRASTFARMLENPIAKAAYRRDMDHLDAADCLILVLPCGKSAHAEFGYAVAQGKKVIVWLEELVQPELLYSGANHIAWTLEGVLSCLEYEARVS